jgi:hypothetical protein
VTKTELKALRNLNLKQQLLFVESYLPDAWEYLQDISSVKLPTFDDNDEVVSWGISQGSHKKEDDFNESIS